MEVMGRMAQSPAIQQMAQRMAEQLDPASSSSAHGGRHSTADRDAGNGGRSRGGGMERGNALDFSSFAQQMLPLLGQVRAPRKSTRKSTMHAYMCRQEVVHTLTFHALCD